MSDAPASGAAKARSRGSPGMGHSEIVACAPCGEADRDRNEANCRPAHRAERNWPTQGPSLEGVQDKLMDGSVDNPMDNLTVAHRLTTARPRA